VKTYRDLVEKLREAGQHAKKKPTGLANEKENAYRRQIADLQVPSSPEGSLSCAVTLTRIGQVAVDQERTLNKRLQVKHKKEMVELVKQLEKEVSASR
jgi:hypothetical protein